MSLHANKTTEETSVVKTHKFKKEFPDFARLLPTLYFFNSSAMRLNTNFIAIFVFDNKSK